MSSLLPGERHEFPPPEGGWLDYLVAQPVANQSEHPSTPEKAPCFDSELDILQTVLGADFQTQAARDFPCWKRRAANLLESIVAEIDQLVSRQLDVILHHPRFQRLEAAWRGLHFLVRSRENYPNRTSVLVRMLNVNWAEITRQAQSAAGFDQSILFQKIYEEEFGTPGGKPYGLLIGDFEIGKNPQDWRTLESLSGVAAAAFCPVVLGASPSLFGIDRWDQMPRLRDIRAAFDGPEFVRWRSFRAADDSRYVGLALPRVLMRKPYERYDGGGFIYREDVTGPDSSRYLWGSATFALAAVTVRAYAMSGWLADIRGVERGIDGGGIVPGLPVHPFATDRPGVWGKSSVEVLLTDRREAELSTLGFLPLSHCVDTELAAFYSTASLHQPPQYSDPDVTANARLSSMLQYTLCVCRFAHYLKCAARDWVGSGVEAREIERRLHTWIIDYVVDKSDATVEEKIRRPLRHARVRVESNPGRPGAYQCACELWPHYQIDYMTASIHLKTNVITP